MRERNFKQTIEENYEDALFAKLMYEHAQIEGTLLLEENERLKNDSEFHMPDGLDERCMDTIQSFFKAKKRKERRHKAATILKRTAIVLLICAALFTGLWCTASAFREAVYKVFLTMTEEKTEIQIRDDSQEKPSEYGENSVEIEVPKDMIVPTYVPEGYTLTYFSRDEMQRNATYENNTGDEILYTELSEGFSCGIDTEDAEVETVSINGYEGILVSKKGLVSINWADTDRAVLIRIASKAISKEEILKMAKSV